MRETYDVVFDEQYQYSEGVSNPMQLHTDTSTLVVGETGAGKSSAIKMLLGQVDLGSASTVIHEYGRNKEFEGFLTTEHPCRNDLDVLTMGLKNSDVIWSLFEDIESEVDLKEITDAVFGEMVGDNPFFGPAQQVLEAILKYLYRELSMRELGHDKIVQFVEEGMEKCHGKLTAEGPDGEYRHPDLIGYADYIDPESGTKASQSIWQELTEAVTSSFVEDFARNGSFSMREFFENPDGRVLLIHTLPQYVATVGQMYRLLLDWGIRVGMATEAEVNYVLDEVDSLDPMEQIGTLAARGRSLNCKSIIGVQTLGQLEEQYQNGTSRIIGNTPQEIHFSAGEKESAELAQQAVGKVREEVTRKSHPKEVAPELRRDVSVTKTTEDRYPVTTEDMNRLDRGECIVVNRTDWVIGDMTYYKEALDMRPRNARPGGETTGDGHDGNAPRGGSDGGGRGGTTGGTPGSDVFNDGSEDDASGSSGLF